MYLAPISETNGLTIQVTGSTKMNDIESAKLNDLWETVKELISRIEDLENTLEEQSPFPRLSKVVFKEEPQLMDFSDALRAMKEGKKVAREKWRKNHFIFIKNDKIFSEYGDEDDMLTIELMMATDWYIVE